MLICLRMRYVSGKTCRENQNTRFVFSSFFEKPCLLWDNVGKYGQATDGSIIRRMRIACRMTKSTDTQSECVILLVFRANSGYANVAQCYVHTYVTCLVQIWWRDGRWYVRGEWSILGQMGCLVGWRGAAVAFTCGVVYCMVLPVFQAVIRV
jgi:hypothetical protein